MSTNSSVFPGTTTVNGASNQVVLGTANTITLSASAPSASRVYNFADLGVSSDVLLTNGTQTITGTKTLSGDLLTSGNILIALPIGGTGTTGVITAGGNRFIHNDSPSTSYNLCVGINAGNFSMTGTSNCFIGSPTATLAAPGAVATSAATNTVVGCAGAAGVMTTALSNILIGYQAGNQLTTGSAQIAIGARSFTANPGTAGNGIRIGPSVDATTPDAIVIATQLVNGPVSQTRIGRSTFQTSCAIFGISGATSTGGSAVLINTSSVLGTTTSSQRFKKNIADIPDSLTDILLSLPLKQFTYINDPTQEVQYGAIAETVLPLWPQVIAYEEDGVTPNSIQYQKWLPVSARISQLQHTVVDTLQKQLASLQSTISILKTRANM